MTERPRTTVVVPFFETPPELLRDAVESVLSQTSGSWELLLVDDGSTGPSTGLARELASGDARIRYLDHPGHRNRGQSATRNLGFSVACGDYIALLDADDVWLPRKLEEQVALLDDNPAAGMLYGNTLYWYSWEGSAHGRRDHLANLGIPPGTLVEPPRLLTLMLQGYVAVPCTCSVLARREVVQSVGGFEESARAPYGDQIFYAKMFLRSSVLVMGSCWDLYRQRRTSLSHSPSVEEGRGHRRYYLEWLEGYLTREEIQDESLWRALRREQWKNRYPAFARSLRMRRRLARRVSRAWSGARSEGG